MDDAPIEILQYRAVSKKGGKYQAEQTSRAPPYQLNKNNPCSGDWRYCHLLKS